MKHFLQVEDLHKEIESQEKNVETQKATIKSYRLVKLHAGAE